MPSEGAPLSPTSRCPSCGEQNPVESRFCSACGARLADAGSLREERKLVSILFVDLVGFTARSDRADPEDVREALQLYHADAKRRIEAYDGALEKFIGDAVMAVFGAPVAHGDDAERVCSSSARIVSRRALRPRSLRGPPGPPSTWRHRGSSPTLLRPASTS
jgi:class 3 adenylate cyclase